MTIAGLGPRGKGMSRRLCSGVGPTAQFGTTRDGSPVSLRVSVMRAGFAGTVLCLEMRIGSIGPPRTNTDLRTRSAEMKVLSLFSKYF